MRIKNLPRMGMYKPAYNHIKKMDPDYILADWDEVEKTLVYDPSRGTTSKEFDALCKRINSWLNKHYDMFELDYTHFYDCGSRAEVILCYTKRLEAFESPDFETELPKLVLYR